MELSPVKNQSPSIIIDLGSNSIKFGLSSDLFPSHVIPNIIGKKKQNLFSLKKNSNNHYFGNDALYNSPSLDISYPLIESGGKFSSKKENLDDFEKLFTYIFKEKLQVEENNFNIFIIDSMFTSFEEQKLIAQILFEKFQIYHLMFQPQSIMTLYTTSKTSGLIVNSGEMTTEIVPIYEGYIISDCVKYFPISGYHLTKTFIDKYKKDFELYNVCNKYYMGQKIKEKFIEILPSHKEYEDMMNKTETNKKEYILPDGNIINIGNEIYEIPESIFHPEILNVKSKGLPQMIVDSINKCGISTRKELLNNIILGGGNISIKGFDSRLKTEINDLTKKNCGIIPLEERGFSSWIGASRISTLGNFENQWISRADYYSGIKENNLLFNYNRLNDKTRKLMNIKEMMNPDNLYKNYIIREQI